MNVAIALLAFSCSLGAVCAEAPLQWPEKYTAEGRIILPYAQISEPYRAVVDLSKGMSLLSTYDGMYVVHSCIGAGSHY